ncbi:CoA-transferase family III [Klenkia soli]|uniref:CoA-transferase family III n=1 Tax=Klenkia soli TaxID=1052260 RepID=A0A1H0UF35_9ACTN|nr:CoA transferase [Klenkia soli]SDP64769.1 CoA-transferase family III [Klenkia soli]
MTTAVQPLGALAAQAWADLGGSAADLDLVRTTPAPLPSRLRVGPLCLDAVGVASLAAQLCAADRSGRPARPLQVDGVVVAASAGSERVFRLDGAAPAAFAPLSGFWPTADGWVRTHGNYPHHAARLRSLLGLADTAGPDQLRAALAGRRAHEVEEAAAGVGALVVAVRTPEQWAAHPQQHAVAELPLISHDVLAQAPARPWAPHATAPLDGVRVLDLTRVIAGPVAGRDLALMGAQVLRVDPPAPAEIAWQHLDTGQDKHSAVVDLHRDPEVLAELLDDADVVLTGYRPGSLDRFGLSPEALARRYPGIVVGRVSAWGTVGPWAQRRGFDSLVQAVCGIAVTESPDGVVPGALPVQALDHASGHLLAAGVATALRERARTGGSRAVSVALARTALALQQLGPGTPSSAVPDDLPSVGAGRIRCAPPVLAHEGAPRDYARLGSPWGADPPRWW